MIDIRDYPGALETINKVLNSEKEATVKLEDGNLIGVAEHTRYWHGQFEPGAMHRCRQQRRVNHGYDNP